MCVLVLQWWARRSKLYFVNICLKVPFYTRKWRNYLEFAMAGSAACCAPSSPILMHPVFNFFSYSGLARLLLLVVLFLWCWGCCCSCSRLFLTLSFEVRITLSWPSTSFPPTLFWSWSLSMPVLLPDYRKCHSCSKSTYLGDKTSNLFTVNHFSLVPAA